MFTPIDISRVVWVLPRRRHIIRAFSIGKKVCADCFMYFVILKNAVHVFPAGHLAAAVWQIVTFFVVVLM